MAITESTSNNNLLSLEFTPCSLPTQNYYKIMHILEIIIKRR